MKKIIIFIIIIIVSFSTISSAFSAKKEEKLDISEESGVKGWIIRKNAENYCKEFNVKLLKMYNIKVIKKNKVRSNIGAVIKSYLVTAEVEVQRYGHFYTAYYVYTGEMEDKSGEMYYVDGNFASAKYPKQMIDMKMYLAERLRLVEENSALNIASLRLMMR